MTEYNMIDGYDPFYTGEPVEQLPPYIVYVKIDDAHRIIAVNSSAFLIDLIDWVEIDRGFGDRYHHAQGNYFPDTIMDERGIYRYLHTPDAESKWRERMQEEMDADYVEPVAEEPSQLDIIEAQVTYTAMMTDTLLEV